MRKHYLDNIRFLTIFFVVIFHVYFYYNNIGTEAMFAGLIPYEGAVTFAGIYQYFVYPWFMLLLFVVAGISARYALEKRTERQFLKERVDKILAPSTLGVLAFGWLGGYVIYLHTAWQYAGECTGFCESHYHLMLWYRGTVVLPCIVCGSTISASDPENCRKMQRCLSRPTGTAFIFRHF